MTALALDSLTASDVRFAILHGAEQVKDRTLRSDVDLVSADTPSEILSKARDLLAANDLHPILVWPYDINSASIFIVNGTGTEGTQLDVVSDSDGHGRYGLRAPAFLDMADTIDRWPTVDPDHELLYLLRKRISKGQTEVVEALVAKCNENIGVRALDVAPRLFSPQSAEAVVAALQGNDQPISLSWVSRRATVTITRIVSRVVAPVGFWVALVGSKDQEYASAVSHRLDPVLPIAIHGATIGSPSGIARDMRLIVPARLRAGVVATTGPLPQAPKPDRVIDSDLHPNADSMMRELVASMAKRAQS